MNTDTVKPKGSAWLRSLARLVSFFCKPPYREEKWHIAWVFPGKVADGIFTISPPLKADGIPQIREHLAKQSNCQPHEINITALTRFGS